MDFRVLGPLEVIDGQRQLTPRRAKQRALLAALLLRANGAVAVDWLIEMLWGATPPQTARSALHGHVSALRKLLGAERIETRPSGYLLRAAPDEVDASRFEALVAQAQAAAEPSRRLALLRSALALWRGDPLPELRDDAASRGSVAGFEELRASALDERIDAELELGLHDRVVPELERLVREDPLRERRRAQLMLALYRAGRTADALHHYQEGRRAASEELGLDPGPALQALEQQILVRDPALELQARPAPVPQQARKVVTVVIAELTPPHGSDPEDLERIVEPAMLRARGAFARYGGTVQPLFANALLAVFGARQAHEDDAERAVLAADALKSELAPSDSVVLRAGVHTGRALVTVTGDRVDVAGDVLATASRLQATAPHDGISVSSAVRAAIRALHDASSHEIPFTGRAHELALLERTFEGALRKSAAVLVTILGEPGSGKTRLAKEFRTRLERSTAHVFRQGRCLPYGEGVTFWALGEIVKEQAGILESDGPEASSDKLDAALAALVADGDERAWLKTRISPLVGIAAAAPASRDEAFAAWRRFIEAIAWRSPLVLLFEDLHWADAALLEFVDRLVDEASAVPLVVIATARLELFNARAHWAGGKRDAATITLPPLTEEEIASVARAVLGGIAPSPELVRRAGGNPLFAQELARMVAGSAAHVAVPESLEAVIAARIDTLAPELRDTVAAAAIVGEVFWTGAVAAVAAIAEREVEDRLRRLAASGLLRRARTTSVHRQSEYHFVHGLVRDVAYGQIPKQQRARKHEAAGGWIERLAADRVADRAELIAHHYGAARELAVGLGQPRQDLDEKTAHYLVVAGDRAMHLDVSAADRLYTKAFEIVASDHAERPAILARLARTAEEAGRLGEAETRYEQAITAFRVRGDALGAGAAMLDRAQWDLSDAARHGRTIDDALASLEPHPIGPEVARAWMLKGRALLMQSRDAHEALPWIERALGAAQRLGDSTLEARCFQFRGLARHEVGDARAVEDLAHSLRLGRERGLGFETAMAHWNLGDTLVRTAGPAEALRIYREGITFAQRRGLVHSAMWLRSSVPLVLFELGEWDELMRAGDEVLEWDRAQGTTPISTFVLAAQIQVLVHRGAVDEAADLADRMRPYGEKTADLQLRMHVLPSAALAALARGDSSSAIALVRDVEEATRKRPAWRSHRIADCVRVSVAGDELALADAFLDGADTSATRMRGSVFSARGALAEARGEFVSAASLYAKAGAVWSDLGHRPELGFALLGQARCSLALGRNGEAKRPLDAARAIFARLGATQLIAAVDRGSCTVGSS